MQKVISDEISEFHFTELFVKNADLFKMSESLIKLEIYCKVLEVLRKVVFSELVEYVNVLVGCSVS